MPAGDRLCGCCAVPSPETPEPIGNRPGLRAIRYRVGTYASFYHTMVRDLSRAPTLRGWTARVPDDYGIALLQMWAYLGEILAFYQERIANEAFLRTAILAESVHDIAAQIGYRPVPGVASSVHLAFTLEEGKELNLPAGLRVQSVPAQGEKPQKFETESDLAAKGRLNRFDIYPEPLPQNPFQVGSAGGVLHPDAAAEPGIGPGDSIVLFAQPGIWSVGDEATVLSSRDGGLSWTRQETPPGFAPRLNAVQFVATSTGAVGWAVGDAGTIVRTDDGGRTWRHSPVPTGLTAALRAVHFTDEAHGWAVGDGGTVLRWDGSAWFPQPSGVGVDLHGVWFLDPDHGWIVGEGGQILRWDGAQWVPESSSTGVALRAVRFRTLADGWAIGDGGMVLRRGVSGWSQVPAGTDENLRALHLVGDSDVWFVGDAGTIIHGRTTSASATFTAQSPGVTNRLRGVHFVDSSRGWVCGDGSTILVTDDGGGTWKSLEPPEGVTADLMGIAAVHALAGAEDKSVLSIAAQKGPPFLAWSPAVLTEGWTPLGAQARRWARKFRLFGHDAQSTYLVGSPAAGDPTLLTWRVGALQFPPPGDTLDLDAAYDDLQPGTAILVVEPERYPRLSLITEVTQERTAIRLTFAGSSNPEDGPVSATVTRIKLRDPIAIHDPRKAIVYELTGEALPLWDVAYPPQIQGNRFHVPLEQLPELEPGRALVLDDAAASPVVLVVADADEADADGDGVSDHLVIETVTDPPRALDTDSAFALGNVAIATHGETVEGEILGSGSASESFQTFSLQRAPVTYVPRAGAPAGRASSLVLRVNGTAWDDVTTLFGTAPDEQVFTATADAEGAVTVLAGDGNAGSRLPTGVNNVVAEYRQGLGRAGNVPAGTISTLLDRPAGLKGVSNPLDALGGEEAESDLAIRENAPNSVRTFERIVSLRDFEDAARSFGGIAKARAFEDRSAERHRVHLVVAGNEGAPVTGTLLENLREDLNRRRDPNRDLLMESFRDVPLLLEATIRTDPDRVGEEVVAAVEVRVRDFFSFERQDLGRPVYLSEVYQTLHEEPGVVGADIDRLQFSPSAGLTVRELRERAISFRLEGGREIPNEVQGRLALMPWELATIREPGGVLTLRWEVAR